MLAAGSWLLIGAWLCVSVAAYGPSSMGGAPMGLSDALLREMVARMGSDLADPARDYLDLPPQGLDSALTAGVSSRGGVKELPGPALGLDYDALALSPSLRDREYLSHSSLISSVLGGYEGKSKMRTKPSSEGMKGGSEGVLPAYCNPPNPCPFGYTAENGCLEDFENTAVFSRDYQALQDCMCDTEHMFECSDSTRDSEITALARSIQNEGVLDSTLDKIMDGLGDGSRRLVAKKFHQKKSYPNPYLQGEKLPVAAKKGGRF